MNILNFDKNKTDNITIEVLCWLPWSGKTTYWKNLVLNDKKDYYDLKIYINLETKEIIINDNDIYDKIAETVLKKINDEEIKFENLKEIVDFLSQINNLEIYWTIDKIREKKTLIIVDWIIFTEEKDYNYIKNIFKNFEHLWIIYFDCLDRKICLNNLKFREKKENKIKTLEYTIKNKKLEVPKWFDLVKKILVKDYTNIKKLQKVLWLKDNEIYLETCIYRYWCWIERWYDAEWNNTYKNDEYLEKDYEIYKLKDLVKKWLLEEQDLENLKSYFEEVDVEYFDPYWAWEYKKQILSLEDLYSYLKESWKLDKVLDFVDNNSF